MLSVSCLLARLSIEILNGSAAVQACERNHLQACRNLAIMYAKGDGVEADETKAKHYWDVRLSLCFVVGCAVGWLCLWSLTDRLSTAP